MNADAQSENVPNENRTSGPMPFPESAPQDSSVAGNAERQNPSVTSNDPFAYLSAAPQVAEAQRPNPSIVSNDPFGYLSTAPQLAYLPPTYQQAQGRLSSFALSAAGPSTGPSRIFVNPSLAQRLSPPGFSASVRHYPLMHTDFKISRK